jgi:membrane-bound metal-dependent hydrolase YbcI (DUF457 family)
MFIGHFAVGFALKRFAPQTNLGWLVAAIALLDMLWPVFLFAGLEKVAIDPGNTAFTPLNFISYPYTHSLAMSVVWGVVFGGIYFAITRYSAGALAIAVGVVSHWFLDLIVHRADLPLYPGGEKYGLAVWNSIPATLVIEFAMFAIGLWIYLKATKSRDRVGTYVLWIYVAVLLLSYVGNVFSPPPPNETALFFFAPVVWIYIALAAWADRHRALV